MVTFLRRGEHKPPLIDQFLAEYGLSTQEGVILMRLAEAMLRTPDRATQNRLIRDRLQAGDWAVHSGAARSGLVNLTTQGLRFAKTCIKVSGGAEGRSLIARLGDHVLSAAGSGAMVMMGEYFVLGRTIRQALSRSEKFRKEGFGFSYEMLGEAAMTADDAEEAERLEVSLKVIGALIEDPELAGWDGLSIIVQAYQRRASAVILWLTHIARTHDRRIAVRPYWDREIKRAQELGLSSYPVFTCKENTDLSYLILAQRALPIRFGMVSISQQF